METQRANFKTIGITAANTLPIISGTGYTYNNTTGVISSITYSGSRTIADVKVGDTAIDVSTGGKATITAVNVDDDEFTIAAGLSASFNGADFQIHQNPNSNTALIAAADRSIYSVNSKASIVPDTLIYRLYFVGGTSPTATLQWYAWHTGLKVWVTVGASGNVAAGGNTATLAIEGSLESSNDPYVYPYVSALNNSPAKCFISWRTKYISAASVG
jgi:hypothetical protein